MYNPQYEESEMKSIIGYLIWCLIAFNVYVYLIWPEFVIEALWKWDVFMVMIFAPLIWINAPYKDK